MLSDIDRIIHTIHGFFLEHSMSLSVAESCTGGLIMHIITNIPGASSYFTGGIVAYSSEIKKSILKVPEAIIDKHGVISKETALAMASGVRKSLKTDIGISTTGNLGPDTLEDKDVGLVYFGYSSITKETTRSRKFAGSRKEIKKQAALYALEGLLEFLGT